MSFGKIEIDYRPERITRVRSYRFGPTRRGGFQGSRRCLRDKIFFRLELFVERTLGQPSSLHEFLQANAVEAVLSKEAARDVNDGPPGLLSLSATNAHRRRPPTFRLRSKSISV